MEGELKGDTEVGWGDPDRKSEVGKLDRKNNSENADREAPKGTNW